MQQIPFIDLFKSALHVSGDKLIHLQEYFLTVYIAFVTMHRLATISVLCAKSCIYKQ